MDWTLQHKKLQHKAGGDRKLLMIPLKTVIPTSKFYANPISDIRKEKI